MRGVYPPPGQTALGLAQWLVGANQLAAVVAGVLVALALLGVASMWWRGAVLDARRHLQMAVIPIAATFVTTRAYTYELPLWLASGWLLMRLAQAQDGQRRFVLGLVFVGWWSSNLAMVQPDSEWAAAGASILLAAMVWRFHRWTKRGAAPCSATEPSV